MSCLLLWASVCLIDPSNIYLKASTDYMLEGPQERAYIGGHHCDTHWCKGPLTSVELGMTIEVSREWTVTPRVKHASFIQESGDRGDNSFGIDVVWRPFRR